MTTVKNIYDYINSIAPFDAQEEWDNSGHLVGDYRKEVKKCVMALDCTKDVCRFARDVGADLVDEGRDGDELLCCHIIGYPGFGICIRCR